MLFALNHITASKIGFVDFLALAGRLGCVGVELRNDISGTLFDAAEPAIARNLIQRNGMRLLALGEVKDFNCWTAEKSDEALAIMKIAQAVGAEAINLVPRNDGFGLGNGERQANLRVALRELRPMLAEYGLIGLIEPLGFQTSSLQHKSEAVDAIEAMGGPERFRLVHNTFHHHLAGDGPLFARHTGIVHISGVTDPAVATTEMTDAHRVLIDAHDRVGNLAQIDALQRAGYKGPFAFETFAPSVGSSKSLAAELGQSIAFIRSRLVENVA